MKDACPLDYNDITIDKTCHICEYHKPEDLYIQDWSWNRHMLEFHNISTFAKSEKGEHHCIYMHYHIKQRVVR